MCAWCSGILTVLIFPCLCSLSVVLSAQWFFWELMLWGFKVLFTLTVSQERESVTLVIQFLSALWWRWTASQQTVFVLTRDTDYTAPLLFPPKFFAPWPLFYLQNPLMVELGLLGIFLPSELLTYMLNTVRWRTFPEEVLVVCTIVSHHHLHFQVY